MPLRNIPPLHEKGWKQLTEALKRELTPEQRERVRQTHETWMFHLEDLVKNINDKINDLEQFAIRNPKYAKPLKELSKEMNSISLRVEIIGNEAKEIQSKTLQNSV